MCACVCILSLRFKGHFPGGPGLAGTRKYPFWILLQLRVMEVVVTTGAIRRANLQSNVIMRVCALEGKNLPQLHSVRCTVTGCLYV